MPRRQLRFCKQRAVFYRVSDQPGRTVDYRNYATERAVTPTPEMDYARTLQGICRLQFS